MDIDALAPDGIHADAVDFDVVAAPAAAAAVFSPADNIVDDLGVDERVAVAENVGSGNAAAQICLDFYGALNVEVDSGRLGFD